MENSCLIIGIPTESTWSICTELVQGKDTLSLALTVQGKDTDASIIGREIVHTLQTWIEDSPDFEKALTYFPHFSFPPDSEVVIWYTHEDQSLFAVLNGVVGVRRQGKYFEIVSLSEQFQCVQGKLFPGDTLLYGTRLFASKILPSLSVSAEPLGVAAKYASGEKGELHPALCGQVRQYAMSPQPIAAETVIPHLSPPRMTRSPAPQTRMKTNPFPSVWLRLSPQHKKIIATLVFIGAMILAALILQRLVLTAREKRIHGVTAPLSERLSTITASSASRMEKEKLLTQLIADTAQARTNSASDIAIERELSSFEVRLQKEYQLISRQRQIDHLSVFYDFRLISTDFVASQIQYDIPGRLAVFLDTARGKIVSLSLEKKQPQALSINADVGKLHSLTVVDRKAYLLGTSGIYEVSLPLDTQGKIVASASAEWTSPERIGSFAKNIYVFDPGSRQIFRYDRDDFSASASAWLRGKEGVELESITSMAIDGDIWMGTNQGGMYRFSRGDRKNFSYTDIVNSPDTSVQMYTAELLPNIYVLEPRARRIVIFDKSGAYASSIVSPDLETATSLIVDEDGTKAYVLSGSLVYEVELQ